jgi:hypothetical protein
MPPMPSSARDEVVRLLTLARGMLAASEVSLAVTYLDLAVDAVDRDTCTDASNDDETMKAPERDRG